MPWDNSFKTAHRVISFSFTTEMSKNLKMTPEYIFLKTCIFANRYWED
jgi:hypothetical protein